MALRLCFRGAEPDEGGDFKSHQMKLYQINETVVALDSARVSSFIGVTQALARSLSLPLSPSLLLHKHAEKRNCTERDIQLNIL